MTAIGILGGMGPQASARLHAMLIRDTPKHTQVENDTDFPEIVHISASVPNFVHEKTNLETATKMLVSRTKILELAGCGVIGVACNTAHLMLRDLQTSTTVPFVSLPNLVAQKITDEGFKRVGLLATPNTLQSNLYDDAINSSVTIVRPNAKMTNLLEAMIFRQLKGVSLEADTKALHEIVNEFLLVEKLDVVILGCTELPLVFGDEMDEKVINTLQVLSDGLLARHFST